MYANVPYESVITLYEVVKLNLKRASNAVHSFLMVVSWLYVTNDFKLAKALTRNPI